MKVVDASDGNASDLGYTSILILHTKRWVIFRLHLRQYPREYYTRSGEWNRDNLLENKKLLKELASKNLSTLSMHDRQLRI